jgi:hypothetical protein
VYNMLNLIVAQELPQCYRFARYAHSLPNVYVVVMARVIWLVGFYTQNMPARLGNTLTAHYILHLIIYQSWLVPDTHINNGLAAMHKLKYFKDQVATFSFIGQAGDRIVLCIITI